MKLDYKGFEIESERIPHPLEGTDVYLSVIRVSDGYVIQETPLGEGEDVRSGMRIGKDIVEQCLEDPTGWIE